MIYFEKLKLYQIKKGMKNETKFDKENFEDRPFTFKITKKRSPWTSEVSMRNIKIFIGRRSYNGISK
jgi:hypothetical protein